MFKRLFRPGIFLSYLLILPVLVIPFFMSALLFFMTESAIEAQSIAGRRQIQNEALQLIKSTDSLPCTVEIVGPAVFVSKANSLDPKRYYGWGPGLRIDWGDGCSWPQRGSKVSEAESSVSRHRYTVPGTYKIRAFLYHHGPNDGSVTDWYAEAVVEVSGGNIENLPLSLEILSPGKNEVYGFQEFPVIKWRLQTNKSVNILFQMLDLQNNLIGMDELKNISFNSEEQEKRLSLRAFAELEKSLSRGNHKFKIRMIVSDQSGNQILSKESKAFTMTDEFKSNNLKAFIIEPEGRPLEASVSYMSYHVDDLSYILDWGDGSPPVQALKPLPLKGSMLKAKQLVFRHKYAKPGRYQVKIRSNDGRIFTDLEKIPYYEAVYLEVGG